MAQARRTAGLIAAVALLAWGAPAAAEDTARSLSVMTTVLWMATGGEAFAGEEDRHYAGEANFFFRQYGLHPAVKTTRRLHARGFAGPRALEWVVTGSNAVPDGAGPHDDITEAELADLRRQLADFGKDTNYAAFEKQEALRQRGYDARVAQALAGRDLPEGVSVVPLPLTGDGCYSLAWKAKRYVVVNPTVHTEKELRACLQDAIGPAPD